MIAGSCRINWDSKLPTLAGSVTTRTTPRNVEFQAMSKETFPCSILSEGFSRIRRRLPEDLCNINESNEVVAAAL